MNSSPRVFKAKVPAHVIISAVLIVLSVVGFLVLTIWQSGTRIVDAKMTGIIVSKEFKPLSEPAREITLNREGTVSARHVDGEYILTVEVPQKDGSKKAVNVWLNDKARYDAVKVGDSFDVGPFYLPTK